MANGTEVAFSFDGPKHNPVDVVALQSAIDAELGTAAAPPPEPAKPAAAAAPPPEPIKQAEPAPAAEAAPAAKSPASALEELKTHKIVVDGQELEVTEADLKAGHMRQRDYTIKTQQVAAEKAKIEAERQEFVRAKQAYEAELAQIDQFLRDKAAIDKYIAKAFGSAPTPVTVPVIDPNKPPTVEEVAQIARYNAEQVRLSNQQQIDALREEQARSAARLDEAQKNVERTKLAEEIDRHIATVIDKNPLLKRFDGIEEELIGMAAKYNPRSLDEAKTRLAEAADRKLAAIKSIVEEEKKAAAVEAARLKKTSTEPPGGQAPSSQHAVKKVSMDVKDRKDRLESNEAWLREAMSQTS